MLPGGERSEQSRHYAGFGFVAALLALVLTVAIIPKANSKADTGDVDIVWAAPQASIEKDPDGTCHANIDGSITTGNAQEATITSHFLQALRDQPYNDPQPGFGSMSVERAKLNTAENRVAFRSTLGVECGIAVKNRPVPEDGRRPLPVPIWLNGGVSSLAANILYVVVGSLVTAGIVLAVGQVTLSAAVQTALIALAGCLGGAAMTAATHALSGAAPGWRAGLVDGATGCISGTTFALLPVRTIGTSLARVIGRWAGRPVQDVLGASLTTTTRRVAPDPSTVARVLDGVAMGARNVG